MSSNRVMRASEARGIAESIEQLVSWGGAISIERRPSGPYEVTVYAEWPNRDGNYNHAHHTADTLLEALHRAVDGGGVKATDG